jgi:hypothetical protein
MAEALFIPICKLRLFKFCYRKVLQILFLFCFYGIGVWTQGLHLEPLHQPFFVLGFSRQGLANYLS